MGTGSVEESERNKNEVLRERSVRGQRTLIEARTRTVSGLRESESISLSVTCVTLKEFRSPEKERKG